MFRSNGKPKNWFATTLVGAGFSVLLVALVLAAATPSLGSFPAADTPEAQAVAQEGAPETAELRTSPVTVDLAGWELYLHSAEVGLSNVGLAPAGGSRPAAVRFAVADGPAPAAVPLLFQAHYRPQAPPA
jgi:hypothetical protein